MGMGRRGGMGPRARLEARPRWSAHPFGGIECRGHAQYPAFAPAFAPEVARLGALTPVVYHLSQLHKKQLFIPAVSFVFVAGGGVFPGQALQPRVLCPPASDSPLRHQFK